MSALSLETKPIPMRVEARRKFMESNMDQPAVIYSKKSTKESKEYYKSETLEASREVRTTEEQIVEKGSPKFFHQRFLERSASEVDVVDSSPLTYTNYSSSPSVIANSERFSTKSAQLLGSNRSLTDQQHQDAQKEEQLQQQSNKPFTRHYFNSRSSPSPNINLYQNGKEADGKMEYNIRIEKSPDVLLNPAPDSAPTFKERNIQVEELEESTAEPPEDRKFPPLDPQMLVQSELDKGNKTSYDFVPIMESRKKNKKAKKLKSNKDKKKSSVGDTFCDAFVFLSDCFTCNGDAQD